MSKPITFSLKWKSNKFPISLHTDTASMTDLKHKVWRLTSIPVRSQKLLLKGKRLTSVKKLYSGCILGIIGNPKATSARQPVQHPKPPVGINKVGGVPYVAPENFSESTHTTPTPSENSEILLENSHTVKNDENVTKASLSTSPQSLVSNESESSSSSVVEPVEPVKPVETIPSVTTITTDEPVKPNQSHQSIQKHKSPLKPIKQSKISPDSSQKNVTSSKINIQKTPLPMKGPVHIPSVPKIQDKEMFFPSSKSIVCEKKLIPKLSPETTEINKFSVKEYCDFMRAKLNLERIAEIQQHVQKVYNLSRNEKCNQGLALFSKILVVRYVFNDYLRVRIIGATANENSETKLAFRLGSLVRIIPSKSLKDSDQQVAEYIKALESLSANSNSLESAKLPNIDGLGTVSMIRNNFIEVDIKESSKSLFSLNSYTINSRVYVEVVDSDIAFKRRLIALKDLVNYSTPNSFFKFSPATNLISFAFSQDSSGTFLQKNSSPVPITFFHAGLNDSQKLAVWNSIYSKNPFSLVHGPPGTGKTTVLVEIILQLVKQGNRILVCAASNAAVDNIVVRLAKYGFHNMVRIGSLARYDPIVLEYALESHIESFRSKNKHLRQIEKKLESSQQQLSQQFSRQVLETVKSLRSDLKVANGEAYSSILESCPVVLSTLISIQKYQKILFKLGPSSTSYHQFPFVVIDEASQSVEAESWLGLMMGKRAILAGDYLQLPPTIIDKQVAKHLSVTLFDRLIAKDYTLSTLLTLQYRMNKKLCKFASQELYDSLLETHTSNENILLKDICSPESSLGTTVSQLPLVFLDTSYCDYEEEIHEDSRRNPQEAEILVQYLDILLEDCQLSHDSIGIIVPYSAQAELLRKMIPPTIECSTVDGFQGREKECILVSFVRSNNNREIGFLSDFRRLNVAITRAKRQLLLVGDAQTLSILPFLADLFTFVEENGIVITPDIFTMGENLEEDQAANLLESAFL